MTHPVTSEFNEYLADIYLDWRNNYLTVAKFAEHRGITEACACKLIDAARIAQDLRASEFHALNSLTGA